MTSDSRASAKETSLIVHVAITVICASRPFMLKVVDLKYSSPYDKYHIASHARRVHGTDRLRDVLVDNAAEFEDDIQYWTQIFKRVFSLPDRFLISTYVERYFDFEDELRELHCADFVEIIVYSTLPALSLASRLRFLTCIRILKQAKTMVLLWTYL
uniref:Uncharacterized protein n=1 Tax=Parascaris equorum TaxID=6256 RepID=A0A914S1Q4_PAREQ